MNCYEQLELMRAAGSVGDFERVTELAIDLLKWTRQQRANSSLRTVEEKASALLPANMVSHVSEESDGEEIEITLATGNDSFREHPASEIARILRELADRFEQGNPPEKLFDYNGGCVGSVRIERV